MLRPPPFPISIEQLSAEVLSEGLDAPVTGFEATRIGADRGMLGAIFRLDLEYGGSAPGAPPTIVAKFAALRDGSLASARRGGNHERELRFYDELASRTPVRVPGHLAGWYDPETAHFLLLQEAIESDATADQVAGLTADQVDLVLREAAALHATWWRSAELEANGWLPRVDGAGRIHNLTTLARAGWPDVCAMLGDALTPAERELGAEFPERLASALREVAVLPSTLVHSDLRPDNLLFSPDGASVTIVDWQGCGTGPPAFDLAYLICQSLTVDDRRRHEAALLDAYRGHLEAAGLSLTADEVRDGYAASLHYGLVIACALPLISDPNEPRVIALAEQVARRSIESLRDHGQLWGGQP